MGLFKSKQQKEFEKRMAIKKTANEMNKQIDKLTEAEKSYIELAKRAKINNLSNQYSLAISGLRSTIVQKKRVQEMLLNFEIMQQSKDVAFMTTEFLKGMSSLSKDMVKLCDGKQFDKVAQQFDQASVASQMAEEKMSAFLDNSKDTFDSLSKKSATANSDEELDAVIDAELKAESEDKDIDAQIKEIEKAIAELN